MKRTLDKLLALVLALALFLQISGGGIAYAAELVDQAVNPAEQIQLILPDSVKDGNYFFIRESARSISESSTEKLYIPIQRSGDLSAEAEVTLKVTDLTAHRGVNYDFAIYKDPALRAETTLDNVAVIDIVDSSVGQVEVPETTEEELGQYLLEAGEVEAVDAEGNVVGVVVAQPAEGNPYALEDDTADLTAQASLQEEGAYVAGDGAADAIALRNLATGTASDRQKLAGSGMLNDQNPLAQQEAALQAATEMVEDSYPGEEYRLHFAPGQEARFVVITPRYDPAADGDAQIMLYLKSASEGMAFPEDFGPAYVSILDEDESQPVVIGIDNEGPVWTDSLSTWWAATGCGTP